MKQFATIITVMAMLLLTACGEITHAGALSNVATMESLTTEEEHIETALEEPTTQAQSAKARPPINCPASYPDAPEAYRPILDDLYKYVQLIKRDDVWDAIDSEYLWGETHFAEPVQDELGYAVADINRDGTPELLLVSETSWHINDEGQTYNDKERPYIHSLFTLKDNQPVNVDYYWSRYNGNIAADGTIFTIGSGGASYHHLASWQLKPDAIELTQLTESNSDNSYFYEVVDGEKRGITEEAFSALWAQYSNPAPLMKLKFIPIEQ